MPDVTEVPSISLRPEDTEKRLRHARKATQTEIARALKAVKSTGLVIVRVEVEGAKIVIQTGAPESADKPASAVQQWRARKYASASESWLGLFEQSGRGF
jgi:hypothetical protein